MTTKNLSLAIISIFILTLSSKSFSFDSYYDPMNSNYNEARSEQLKAQVAQDFLEQDRRMQSGAQPIRSHNHITHKRKQKQYINDENYYSDDSPSKVSTSEKVIIIDPVNHRWSAYSPTGKLIRSGLATAGARWCEDIGRPCKTKAGVFRIYSLGNEDCVSSKYPIEEGGGAPMPYCMYFNGSQGLHGSNNVIAGNISHGCVRLRTYDAEWLRYHFVTVGTKVIIKPY